MVAVSQLFNKPMINWLIVVALNDANNAYNTNNGH